MSRRRSDHGPRPYPHGSGDRNAMPSPDIEDTPLHRGGDQKRPSVTPAAEDDPDTRAARRRLASERREQPER